MNRRDFILFGTACAAGTAIYTQFSSSISGQFAPADAPPNRGMLKHPVTTDKVCENCNNWDEVADRYVRSISTGRSRLGFCRLKPPVGRNWSLTANYERCTSFSKKEAQNENSSTDNGSAVRK